jgi:alanyl-tRNA synthetase
MGTASIRDRYIRFFAERGHAVIPRAILVPREDPTTLFTGSGMQPLLPYLLGDRHPAGDRLVNSQTCLRSEDIDEVGDTRHTTFFEMLGNWSLGSYWKEEQIPWVFEFLTNQLGLDPNRLYATAFSGSPDLAIPRDEDSVGLWVDAFASHGIAAEIADLGSAARAAQLGLGSCRVCYYETEAWWSRSGSPNQMPVGEPGGPDSEVFYEFPQVEHDLAYGPRCHPHCDCGRFLEIGNSVFLQYQRTQDGFAPLPRRNVDFGGGLERLAMAQADHADVFRIDLLWPLIDRLQELAGSAYEDKPRPMRIIADHVRAATFLGLDGVEPSNTAQGYVMRRLLRRAVRQGLLLGVDGAFVGTLVESVAGAYHESYPELDSRKAVLASLLDREESAFRTSLTRGVREFGRITAGGLTGDAVFTLFDTFGFPPELSLEEARRSARAIDPGWKERYDGLMSEQRGRSRSAATGLFKGGLSDQSEATTRLHTATHLLYKALRLVLGDHVIQRGSNITPERLRFDFSHPGQLSPEQLAEVQAIVNQNIAADWPISWQEMSPEEAFGEGALGAFGDRYGTTVKVYTMGDPDGKWYSKEICGGPHIQRTSQVGRFQILKEQSSSAGVRRIRAAAEPPPSAPSE